MKRVIKATTKFPVHGTAGPANRRGGIIKFGEGIKSSITLPSGWSVYLPTGTVRLNSNTGEVSCYLNIDLYADHNGQYGPFRKHFIGYTAEEAQKLYLALSSMSAEELDAAYPDTVESRHEGI